MLTAWARKHPGRLGSSPMPVLYPPHELIGVRAGVALLDWHECERRVTDP